MSMKYSCHFSYHAACHSDHTDGHCPKHKFEDTDQQKNIVPLFLTAQQSAKILGSFQTLDIHHEETDMSLLGGVPSSMWSTLPAM